eukprot:29700_1
MAQIEGTTNAGEENIEKTDFYKWLISVQAKHKLIIKLINNGIDSMEMLEEIVNDESILDDTDLNKIEKAKLRTILKKLPNQHNIIDKEESMAILQMENKLKALKSAIKLVANTKQTIDVQVTNHTKSIQLTFKEMHKLLDEREAVLIKKLNEIANKKKNKLDNISKTLNEQTNSSQQEIKTCHRSLKKSIELTELETRKKQILNIAKKIKNINVITKQDTDIVNNKININLDIKLITNTINSFGKVFSGCVPVLISLVDNKNGSVGIKWKLNTNEEKHNDEKHCKLKVEWTDIELKHDNDNNDDMKVEWKYNKEFVLQNKEYLDVDVKVKNKTIVYGFRIKYFDGKVWSIYSDVKSIVYKKMDMEKWDPNAVGPNITININTVTHTGSGGHQSAFLSTVISEGIHVWKIRANTVSSCWNLFGIWKTNSGQPVLHNWFTTVTNNGYAYIMGNARLTKPSSPGGFGPKYGVKCKAENVITMRVNFNTLSLSYQVNQKDYGKAFDIDRTTYRAAVSTYNTSNSYTLLSYNTE